MLSRHRCVQRGSVVSFAFMFAQGERTPYAYTRSIFDKDNKNCAEKPIEIRVDETNVVRRTRFSLFDLPIGKYEALFS